MSVLERRPHLGQQAPLVSRSLLFWERCLFWKGGVVRRRRPCFSTSPYMITQAERPSELNKTNKQKTSKPKPRGVHHQAKYVLNINQNNKTIPWGFHVRRIRNFPYVHDFLDTAQVCNKIWCNCLWKRQILLYTYIYCQRGSVETKQTPSD